MFQPQLNQLIAYLSVARSEWDCPTMRRLTPIQAAEILAAANDKWASQDKLLFMPSDFEGVIPEPVKVLAGIKEFYAHAFWKFELGWDEEWSELLREVQNQAIRRLVVAVRFKVHHLWANQSAPLWTRWFSNWDWLVGAR